MAYSVEREKYTEKLWNNPALPDELKHDLLNPELFTQLTLDASFYVAQREELENLELHSREYIDQIHRKRIVKLKQISQCKDISITGKVVVKPQTVYTPSLVYEYCI